MYFVYCFLKRSPAANCVVSIAKFQIVKVQTIKFQIIKFQIVMFLKLQISQLHYIQEKTFFKSLLPSYHVVNPFEILKNTSIFFENCYQVNCDYFWNLEEICLDFFENSYGYFVCFFNFWRIFLTFWEPTTPLKFREKSILFKNEILK